MREERSATAANHVGRMKAIFSSEIAESISTAKVYEEGQGQEIELAPVEGATTVKVERGNLVRVLERASDKVCFLDAAAFLKPAGSYLTGGWGPEAMLCAASTLYPVLCGLESTYYEGNKHYLRGGLCTNRALYLSDIRFLTNGEAVKADVLVMAEPNRTRALERHRSAAECDVELANRIEAALNIAAENGCKIFAASAFGCGFNGNDPVVVAGLFNQWIVAHPGVFEQIVFVVPNGPVYEAFTAQWPREEVVRPVAALQDDEEADPLEDVPEPVSEGRWVFG